MTNAFLICRFIIFSAVHYVRSKQFLPRAKRCFVYKLLIALPFLFISTGCVIILSGCAGSKSQQVPTITGNNNTITINQAPTVEKASKTSVDAAGSGYGSVKK